MKLYDVPFFGLAFWQTFVFTYHAGNAGLAFGGSWALESLGAYTIARAYIRDLETLQATLRVIFYSIVLAALIATLDTITGSYFVHETLRKMVGGERCRRSSSGKGLPVRLDVRPPDPLRHLLRHYVRTHVGVGTAADLALYPGGRHGCRGVPCYVVGAVLSLGLQFAMMAWNRFTIAIPMRAQITLASSLDSIWASS